MKIYAITDLTCGKQYIGSTTQSLGKRFAGHCTTTLKTKLADAMRANGLDNFRIELLEEIDHDFDRTREGYWIETLATLYPLGYNTTKVSQTKVATKNPGRKTKQPAQKKKSYTLSLSLSQIAELERQAQASGETVSRWVVAKMKLDKAKSA